MGPAAGTTRLNVLPSPRRLRTSIVPPCAWAIASAVGRPRPTPSRALSGSCRPDEEPLEEQLLVLVGDARPVVGDRPADEAVGVGFLQTQRDVALVWSEPLGIRDEVEQGTIEARPVAVDAWAAAVRQDDVHGLAALFGEGADRGGRRFGELAGVELAQLEPDRPGPVAGEVEDLADQVLHPLGVPLHGLEHRPALLGRRV